jgi:heparanase 1
MAGFSHVFRQTFIGAYVPPFNLNYGLVSQELIPNPDFFSSVLHKRLMGTAVLRATQIQSGQSDSYVRIYAHCTRAQSSDSLPPQYVKAGSVTLMVLSTHRVDTVTLSFDSSQLLGSGRLDFLLTSNLTTGDWEKDAVSPVMRLNGVPLQLGEGGTVPEMPPKVSETSGSTPGSLQFPPLSYGFIVLHDAQATACGYQSDAGKQKRRNDIDFSQFKVAIA